MNNDSTTTISATITIKYSNNDSWSFVWKLFGAN